MVIMMDLPSEENVNGLLEKRRKIVLLMNRADILSKVKELLGIALRGEKRKVATRSKNSWLLSDSKKIPSAMNVPKHVKKSINVRYPPRPWCRQVPRTPHLIKRRGARFSITPPGSGRRRR